MKSVIIGSGSWGTALAQVLQDNHQDVIIYGIDENQVRDINENHRNSIFFEDVELNPELKATMDINVVKEADIVLLAVPTFAIESICQQIDPLLSKKTIIINVAKGFHPETNERMSEVIRRSISQDHLSSVVSLIGPSHAEEVVIRQLTSIDSVSLNVDDATKVQELFSNQYLRIYTGCDEVGSELGVAIKNVMAIASGIIAGLGYQDNTRAALITRGLQEMIRFGTHFGGNPQTYIGLTGVGDLIVTCTSVHSRNFEAGYKIGKENDVTDFLATNKKTVEGVRTAKIVHNIATENNIDMPICEEVYQILYQGKEPRTCANDLMLRELKQEF
ncbi:NAD(P)H-dependent glycerol-3-phosphate dehydrogenase [Floccifex sp.]|uniref:NAD(P)H-dependent glycerol-3-phosphate dehydrogenase n=1 Tax=Floccifex sp. TaxID=2815810 RepID=UPI002A75D72E|nr:NAD(P)H-dependent glycerol-3-phosphate dehydrogenase [Floccifex sp.]MDD7281893.1 NAD(P)-dependent glycerol-3-phosphate dehydrogenase [Erysipelotrichaceae bacterium]MDY2958596.1 NAD(P)H-dependent glycerol-3-phosphate dehydrogenase [Floccifex sp.]